MALLMGLFWQPTPAAAKSLAQEVDVTEACFAVADETPEDSQDTLVRFNRMTGQTFPIGTTGTLNIEAILFRADGELLAANAGQLGTLDLSNGAFTVVGNFGTAGGADGEVALNDVDSLGYDLENDVYYGVHRRFGIIPDLLFAFDATTGAHIPNFFGSGIDYLQVEVIADPDDSSRMLGDVDDIALDPVDGTMYAAVNNSGAGGVLATIDPATGDVTATAAFRYPTPNPPNPALAGTVIDDMEGLAFLNDGQLYGSTGDNGPDPEDLNKLFQIDKTTGIGVMMGPFPTGRQDYEGLECLSFQAFIVLEKATNGQDADTPTGPEVTVGDTVTWTYTITNTAALTLTDLVLVDDQEGQVGPGGVADCPPAGAILPPGESLTCTLTGIAQPDQYANSATVTGTTQVGVVFPRQTVTGTDPSHYFGVTPVPGVDIEKATNGEDADTPTGPEVLVGETVTWTYVVVNTGNVTLVDVTVTDDQGVTVTCPATELAPGASMTCTAGGTAQAGQYANTGVVIGTPQSGPTNPVTDSDLSHYLGVPSEGPQEPIGVGDFVWFDDDEDGIQDAGEPGVADIPVRLYRDNFDGAPIGTTTTSESGIYGFAELEPGTYCLEFILPEDLVPSPADVGDDDAVDSDGVAVVDATTVRTGCFALSEGTIDLTRDLGIFEDTTPTAEEPTDQPTDDRLHLYLPHLNR